MSAKRFTSTGRDRIMDVMSAASGTSTLGTSANSTPPMVSFTV
jgi:hypothetical protein